ncbi:MFS transporter [Croceitalea rosinachiae]|uniref:MFS transporter n=1 Tax=Croceitalea rosinachiae TaxID=3075596 RepID=A0ABU3A9F6_9FLAO|nr:MFS transporter [Croceitalea sp. F388]MDT0606837.1 MFS transporter [Croceitalea sp. F388]
MQPPKHILPVIVVAQFFCTSLWFAGNGVLVSLIGHFNLGVNSFGNITSAVQFGFIMGTLLFAVLTLTDRFSPSKVFLWCAILGACFNLGIVWEGNNWTSILIFRFMTGFFLAGIYPVGMKIAADYFDKGLGKSLGYLVGALVLGTALPHFLKWLTALFLWQYVIYATSALAFFGGLLMVLLVPNGPYRKPSQHIDFTAFFSIFKKKDFRAAAFGYFGHMWELYTFWTFVPALLALHAEQQGHNLFRVSFWSFWVIAIGGLACILGGYIAQRNGTKRTASIFLFLSGCCCLLVPLVSLYATTPVFTLFLLFWGIVVIADSPLFSTLVAQSAPPELKGTALTIVNCIGFAITIISIQLMITLQGTNYSFWPFLLLALGPLFGLIALLKKP